MKPILKWSTDRNKATENKKYQTNCKMSYQNKTGSLKNNHRHALWQRYYYWFSESLVEESISLASVQKILEAQKYVHPVHVCELERTGVSSIFHWAPFSRAPRAERTEHVNELLITARLFFNLPFIHWFTSDWEFCTVVDKVQQNKDSTFFLGKHSPTWKW